MPSMKFVFLLLLSFITQGAADDGMARFVPWTETPNENSSKKFRINVTVNDLPFNVPVDTGSTGFLISATRLGFADDSELRRYPPAFEYLSSSHIYYEGFWLPSNLTFTSFEQIAIHADVSVLAVTEKGKCLTFQDGQCDKNQSSKVLMPDEIGYMGIGFGRWSSEQPGGTADHNPLLNTNFEDNPTVRSGYIISAHGVVLGLREEDFTDGWKLTSLTRNNLAPAGRPEWNGTPMCVEVNDSDCLSGTALFDTGIDYAFLGVPSNVTEKVKTIMNGKSVLKNNVALTVKIGVLGDYIGSYSYEVGDIDSEPMMTPTRVQLVREHTDGAFINTGRFFFNGFDLLFDETLGVVGLREASSGDGMALRTWRNEL